VIATTRPAPEVGTVTVVLAVIKQSAKKQMASGFHLTTIPILTRARCPLPKSAPGQETASSRKPKHLPHVVKLLKLLVSRRHAVATNTSTLVIIRPGLNLKLTVSQEEETLLLSTPKLSTMPQQKLQGATLSGLASTISKLTEQKVKLDGQRLLTE
jgi:hypothetical protein